MKTNALSFFSFVFISFLLLFPSTGWSKGKIIQHQNPFVSALPSGSSLSLYGDFIATGTSVLCQNDGHGSCNNAYTGYLYESNLMYKNAVSTSVIPLNSATATLTLPSGIAGTDIVWAGLYWQGHIAGQNASNYTTDSKIQNRNKVDTLWPDGTASSLSADTIWYHDFWGDGTGNSGGYRSFYQGYKDVTALLKNHLIPGTSQPITVGNIKANSGTDWYSYFYLASGAEVNGIKFGFWGNWALVIVYNYPANNIPANAKLKNVQVTHGFDAMVPLDINGYKTFNITLPVNGFLTPKESTVNAKMLFYAAGGEKNIARDAFYIQNANNGYAYTAVSNTQNPSNNPFNGTVSNNGIAIDNTISYYPGLDLDTFDVSQYMTNQQTNTAVKLEATFSNNNGDQSMPGILAFSTELYEPKFCYDYAYSQNGKYFTESNNGTSLPRVQGKITPTDDINVSIYIKNEENSDVEAQNLTLDITDINTSQAIYNRNSTYVVHPYEIVPVLMPDSSLTVSDSQIVGIPHGTINGNEYFYTYYTLTPKAINDINISLNAQINYNLVLTIGGNTVSLPYSYTVGSTKFPLCTGDVTKYEPNWGTFNIAAKGVYNSNDTYPKFNIPTQVVNRPGAYLITAHDANSTPVAYTRELTIPTVVGIEIIDAGKFHNTKASCDEPSSAISERFWVPFVDTTGAKSQVDFQTALQKAIDTNSISITNIKEYFNKARQNTAFRISANVGDANNTVIKYEQLSNGKYRMINFTELIQTYGTCKKTVKAPNGTSTTNQVAVACGNAGNTGVDYFTLAQCHECILGYRTLYTCSRDNFATRPESFNVKLSDLNQTNHAQTQSFAQDRTGVILPNNEKIHIATGYAYRFDINATDHDGNNASSGYTRYFTTSATDHNISFVWQPLSPISPSIRCNDLSSKPLTFNMINGIISSEANLTNVGEYRLNMIDTNWTLVDNNINYMTHHRSASVKGVTTDVSNYFVGFGNALDCKENSSITQNSSMLPSISGNTLTNINGCTIDTNNHDNNEAGLKYRDYNVSSHPYRFSLLLTPSYGVNNNNDFTNAWVYMNDLNDTNDIHKHADMNESMHFRGTISATGYDNTSMSNFVTGCYAQDINISMDHTYSRMPPMPYQYRLFDLNSTDDIISIVPKLTTNPGDANTTIVLSEGNFTKDLNGAIKINQHLNFDRNTSNPINPIVVIFNDLNTTCKQNPDCTMQADLKSGYTTEGNLTVDVNVTHYYGRAYSTDYRGPSAIDTTIRYEVYCKDCNKTDLNITGAQSPTSLNWYQNMRHDALTDGNISVFTSVSAGTAKETTINPITTPVGGITHGLESYNAHLTNANAPYTDRIRMTPSSWLLYNPFNAAATTNDFNVEFTRSGNWAGEGNLGRTVDLNTSTRTNRRMEW